MAPVDREEVLGEDEANDGTKLHEDVQRRSAGILEWIAHCVANHGGLVGLLALHAQVAMLLRTGVRVLLDVLLRVVPGAARVAHGDCHLDATDQPPGQQAEDGLDTKERSRDQRGEHHERGRRNHFLEGSLRRDADARVVVWAIGGARVQQPRVLPELPLHFLDHLHGGKADRLHGHRREPVRQHGPDEQEAEDRRREDVDVACDVQAHDERAIQREGHERGRADREALPNGGGGVSRGVEGVGHFAHFWLQLGHLCDATCVVADGSVAVDRQPRGQGREHPHRGKGDPVEITERKARPDDDREHDHRHDGRLVPERQAVDDVGRRAGLAALADLLRGRVAERRVVLGDQANDEAAHGAAGNAVEGIQVRRVERVIADALDLKLGREEAHREEVHDGEHQDGGADELDFQVRLHSGRVANRRDGRRKEAAHEADYEAACAHEHRKEKSSPACGVQVGALAGKHEGCARGLGEAPEQIRSHSGDVSYVVSDVVRNGGRVPRVVLGNGILHLADEVRPHVCRLGVDAAADAAEHGDAGASEAVARDDLHHDRPLRLFVDGAVDQEEAQEHEEAQAAEREAHDAAGAEGGVEREGPAVGRHGDAAVGEREAALGGHRCPHVPKDGHHHADIAAGHGGGRPQDES
mmetsp:Transcript_9307/g.34855  ORF Transcript_9307/g.34855 Transcript_9307/m.34855 type:complete len:641 (-) Transcript_9307:508-2430(-)|eukprot:scaffold128_cov248-Pinguiococcus_pyrenoidosus.AAC.27